MEKCCTKCGHVRPLHEFRGNPRYKDGFVTWCAGCEAAYQRQWYQRSKARQDALAAAWKAQNPGRCDLAQKRYRAAHPDRVKAFSRNWEAAHPGRMTAIRRDYNRRIRAIEDGKQQFGDAGHFFLVRTEAGYWHAMLPGRPIGRTEQIMARYVVLAMYAARVDGSESAVNVCESVAWLALLPDILTQREKALGEKAVRDLVRRLATREERLSAEMARRRIELGSVPSPGLRACHGNMIVRV